MVVEVLAVAQSNKTLFRSGEDCIISSIVINHLHMMFGTNVITGM
jgi:hypothetical protein